MSSQSLSQFFGNLNYFASLIAALSSLALLFVTAVYAWITNRLLAEARQTRLINTTPRVVAYLRLHEVHSIMVQLWVTNLASAAAESVSITIERVTIWPERFDLEGANRLDSIAFLGPNETIKFDVGLGPDLLRNGIPAAFRTVASYASLDGRNFKTEASLDVESVLGANNSKSYGIDDVARQLEDISKSLKSFTRFNNLKVEISDAQDRRCQLKQKRKSGRSWKSSFKR